MKEYFTMCNFPLYHITFYSLYFCDYLHTITSRCEVDLTNNNLILYLDSAYNDDTIRNNSVISKDVSTEAKQESVDNWYYGQSVYSYVGRSDNNAVEYYAKASVKKITSCGCLRENCSTGSSQWATEEATAEAGYTSLESVTTDVFTTPFPTVYVPLPDIGIRKPLIVAY